MFDFFKNLRKGEHQIVEELLSAYIDGQVSEAERARVERHLARCAHCAKSLESLRWTVGLLREVPALPVPRSFAVKVAPAVERAIPFWQRDWVYGSLKAATALATILFILVLSGDLLTQLSFRAFAPAVAPRPPVVEREVIKEVEEAKEELSLADVGPSPVPVAGTPAPVKEMVGPPATPAMKAAATPAPQEETGAAIAPQPTEEMAEVLRVAPTPSPAATVEPRQVEAQATEVVAEVTAVEEEMALSPTPPVAERFMTTGRGTWLERIALAGVMRLAELVLLVITLGLGMVTLVLRARREGT